MNPFAPLPVRSPTVGAPGEPMLRGVDLAWFGIAAVGYPAIYAWAWRAGGSPDLAVVPATIGVGCARMLGTAVMARRWAVSAPVALVALACIGLAVWAPDLALRVISVAAFVGTTGLVGLAWRAEEARGRAREAWAAGACLGVGVLVPGLVVVIPPLPGALGVQVLLFLWQWQVVRRGLGGR